MSRWVALVLVGPPPRARQPLLPLELDEEELELDEELLLEDELLLWPLEEELLLEDELLLCPLEDELDELELDPPVTAREARVARPVPFAQNPNVAVPPFAEIAEL
jgi:hypothetical protein